jgi:GT2 family glycosyltransferase
MNELVSIIILNWNGKKYIKNCLDSVFAQDYKNIEVIVVDNGSDDGSPQIIQENYDRVLLIRNRKNLGFGEGNNIGIRHAHGDYILIMNNDAEIDRSCVTEMKKAIDKHALYGACASKIYLKYEDDLIDAAGIVVYPDGLSIGRGRLESSELYNREEEVFFASGCCALYRKEMLEDIRLYDEYFDEDFFAYADDTDLGWRARLRGWRCIYTPDAKVHHLHSASTGTYAPMKAFLVERNRIWVQMKCFPLGLLLYGQLFTFVRYLYQLYGVIIGRGASGAFTKKHSRGELAMILLKVYYSALKGLPTILKKRRAVQRKRLISTGEIFALLRSYGIKTRDIAFMS